METPSLITLEQHLERAVHHELEQAIKDITARTQAHTAQLLELLAKITSGFGSKA
jgi:hypothetical protein